MQHNDFRFEIKSVSESDGSFTGLASTYGNVDQQGDAVMPGAFTKTLRDAKGPFPVLAGHDTQEQIGYAELEDSAAGLMVKGKLVLHTEKAKQAYELMKAKALRGLSIGYDTVRSAMKDGVRQLTELKLYEVSVTPFPANEMAVVTGVKAQDTAIVVAQFHRVLSQCTKTMRGY
jgi:HK97 family phage prohead protease